MNGCLLTFLVLFGLAVLGKLVSSPNTPVNSDSSTSATATADPRATALPEVKLNFSWKKGGLDDIMIADFVVHNNSDYTIKDFEIQCFHYAKSGTQIDSNTRTIFDVVKPHSKKGFPEFNMGFIRSQVASSNCSITDLKAF